MKPTVEEMLVNGVENVTPDTFFAATPDQRRQLCKAQRLYVQERQREMLRQGDAYGLPRMSQSLKEWLI